MGSRTTGDVGRHAEQLAFEFLLGHNLRPVARNFHRRGGEIDLIMLDASCLAFIEVRYRTSTAFSRASHTINHRKQQKIIRTAALFVSSNQRFSMHTMRFDVVAIEGAEGESVDWLKDAFRPNNSTL